MKIKNLINNLFNAFSPVEQVRALYTFVWFQIILNIIQILYPHLFTAYKFTCISTVLGIYFVTMVVRPYKILNVLKKSATHHAMTLTAKFINLFFMIFGSIAISYF